MSKICQHETKTINDLYSVADVLKRLKQKVKLRLKFKQKSDLDLYTLYRKENQKEQKAEPTAESDVDSADESIDEKDIEAEQIESGSSSSYSFRSRVDDASCHTYQLTKLKVHILQAVFKKQIKRLEEQFVCRVTFSNDQCKIQGKNVQFKEVVERLRDMMRSILIEKAEDTVVNSLRHSKYLKQILADMRINVYYDGHSYSFWAQKEDMTHQQFEVRISEVQNNARTRVYFCPKKNKWAPGFYQIVKNLIQPKLQALQKLYELKIETGIQQGLIIHAQTRKIAATVEQHVKKILNSLIAFSINLHLSHEQEGQLCNFLNRKCKQVKFILVENLICFALWKANSNKNIKKFVGYMQQHGIKVSRTAVLTIYTSLYNSDCAQQFLSQIGELKEFRQVDIVDSDLVISGTKIMESDGSPKQYMEVIMNFNEFMTYTKEKRKEADTIAEETEVSQSKDMSMDMSMSMSMDVSMPYAPTVPSTKHKKYSITCPFKIQFEQMDTLFCIGRKDTTLQKLVEQHAFLQSTCRHIIYSDKIQLPELQSPKVYVTSDEIRDNSLPGELTVKELRSQFIQDAKYIVQAVVNEGKKNGQYKANSGQFIVTHRIEILQ